MMIKKRLVFFILTLLIFGLWQTGCKKGPLLDDEIVYDIRGEWTITNYRTGGFTSTIKCTFSGSLESGSVTPESGEPGQYYVGREHRYPVEFHFVVVEGIPSTYESFVGQFIDSNSMEGWCRDFEWKAVREVR